MCMETMKPQSQMLQCCPVCCFKGCADESPDHKEKAASVHDCPMWGHRFTLRAGPIQLFKCWAWSLFGVIWIHKPDIMMSWLTKVFLNTVRGNNNWSSVIYVQFLFHVDRPRGYRNMNRNLGWRICIFIVTIVLHLIYIWFRTLSCQVNATISPAGY